MPAPVVALRDASWQNFAAPSASGVDPVFTVAEVAGWQRVEPRTVTRWIVTGKLRAYKVGNRWRITESAVTEFVAAAGQAIA